LLAEFNRVTEVTVAKLLGIDVKTLKNRPLSQQPRFSKVGRERLYDRQSVLDYLAATTVETGGPSRPKRAAAKAARTPSRRRKQGAEHPAT
jgi:hypothetical protein